MSKKSRLATLIAALVALVVLVTVLVLKPWDKEGGFGIGGGKDDTVEAVSRPADAAPMVIGGAPATAAIEASKAFFAKSPAAVVIAEGLPPEQATKAAEVAAALGVPMLQESAGATLTDEINRLTATKVIAYGAPVGRDWPGVVGSATVIPAAVEETPDALKAKLDDYEPATNKQTGTTVVASTASAGPYVAALGTARAAGATVETLPEPDPRTRAELFRGKQTSVIGVGADLGTNENFAGSLKMATSAPTIFPNDPNSGVTVFPNRRIIALYGHPGTRSLGVLGEQGIPESLDRANVLVKEYQKMVKEPVIPGFEIIVTVATNLNKPRTEEFPVDKIKPWVDFAAQKGVYITLDFQPGLKTFLEQVKMYEELLKYPNVGIALDPEWRLKPGQRHMVQIGGVEASEINEVAKWLAEFVRSNNLPQKVFTIHQFGRKMVLNKPDLDTDYPEIATLLHVDGQGMQPDKQSTWQLMQQDLKPYVRMGWKNFYDEDKPMLTPQQTIEQVHPTPWFISYQ